MIEKIADDDGDDLLLVFVNIDRTQAGEQLIHPGKKRFGSSSPQLGTVSSCRSSNNVSASLEGPVQFRT